MTGILAGLSEIPISRRERPWLTAYAERSEKASPSRECDYATGSHIEAEKAAFRGY
jgi:hypothetical protein